MYHHFFFLAHSSLPIEIKWIFVVKKEVLIIFPYTHIVLRRSLNYDLEFSLKGRKTLL